MNDEARFNPSATSGPAVPSPASAVPDAAAWDPLAALGYEAANPSLQSALWLEVALGLPGVRRSR